MTFLAPFFLALAALAGVPLLVHLLRRRVTRRVDFPAVRFLLQSEREHDRERTVRNRLLLLLRLLAVLALVAAVARPMARLGGGGHPPMALAIVLDQSMSTRAVVEGRTSFARLQDVARAVVGQLTPDDRAWLVTSEGTVLAGDASSLGAAVSALTPAEGRGDLHGALRRARALLEAGRPRTPVMLVVTDGQHSALDAEPASLLLDDVAMVVYAPPLALPGNRAVQSAAAEPARWVPSGSLAFAVSGADSLPWRVLLGERTLARGTAAAAPFAEPARVEVSATTADTGWLAGRVEVDADDFPGDDVRHFVVRAAPPPAVTVSRAAGPFVAAAVEALVADGRLRRATAVDRAPVAIASAADDVAGASLRTAPDDPLQVVSANRTLERAGIPWRFGAALRDTVSVRAAVEPASDARTREVTDVPDLTQATVTRRYRLMRVAASAESDTGQVLLTAGGTPWLVAGAGYVVIGSPLALSATDAPVQAEFVPWLRDMITQRLTEDGVVRHGAPGDSLTLPVQIDSLRAPDGSLVAAIGSELPVPGVAGVYAMRRAGRTVGALVVNPEVEESNLTAWGGSVWEDGWIEGAVEVETDAGATPRAVFDRAGGRSIVWPLVLVALLALVLEALVARGAFGPRAERA